MNILWILAIAATALILAGRFYAPLIGRVLGEKADRPTPATTINDGRDYVPTKTPVVFAHHFASIAGAGPIIGPVLALIYGWGPALLWIILGGIFLGAVHDFTATHIALREGGKSITVIARRYIGRGAFVLLIILLVAMLVLVCAVFLSTTAKTLTSEVLLSELKLDASQHYFRTNELGNRAIIGGIASTSVIVITLCSPLMGYLYLKRKWPVWLCSLIAMSICAVSIYVGFCWPVSVKPEYWKWMISGYVLISAGLPVWLFLQSRDFINVHLLYAGIAFMFVALIAAGFNGGGQFAEPSPIPFNNIAEGTQATGGFIWPMMFILIACGAVSGFHSLCASGTTCKQLPTEIGARQVGFYGMLLESFFAVCVICCLLVGLSYAGYANYCYPQMVGGQTGGNWILTFAVGVGYTVYTGLGLPVWVGIIGAMLLLEGFVVTTLDTAIRLTRYLIEEAWACFFGKYDIFSKEEITIPAGSEPAGTGGIDYQAAQMISEPSGLRPVPTAGLLRGFLVFLKQYWVNSAIAVGLMLLLAQDNGYQTLWPIFGASNQLLAALALLICSTWLLKKGRPTIYTLVPAFFMLGTSITSLVMALLKKYIPEENNPLIITSLVVLTLTVLILILTLRVWLKPTRKKDEG